jgi:hypothetical protein
MSAVTSIASAQLRVARQGKTAKSGVAHGFYFLVGEVFIVENSTEPEPCKTCQLAMKTTEQ